ncbi:MAG: hypothetical protein AB1Z23_05750 [Eubacteriales bacterium]
MNVARRLDERENNQYSRFARRPDLHVLENTQPRTYNDSRTYSTVHYRSNSNQFLSQLIITMIVLFLFVSCIGFLAIQAQIASVERDISRLNRDIYELSTENNTMQSIINTATNIETIRENATMLGMTKPGVENVEYISASDASTVSLSASSLEN